MTSLLNADLPSDDEADEDFEPGKAPGGGGGKGTGRGAGKGGKRGFMEVSDGYDDAADDDDDGTATAGCRHKFRAQGLAEAMGDAQYLYGATWQQRAGTSWPTFADMTPRAKDPLKRAVHAD